MNKISSDMTFFTKKVFPTIWMGFVGLFLVAGIIGIIFAEEKPDISFLFVPVIMATFGFFLFKNLVWDLMDEVYDEGDSLVVVNGKKKERINFSDVKNVSYSVMTNPPRVTLSLRTPTELGKEITFSPPICMIPFKKSEIINDLIDRIDQSKS